jgi:uncharacterized membrane protein YgcG
MYFFLIYCLGFFSVFAQAFPNRNDAVATDSRQINIATINSSANDLQALGADVLVLFIEADTGQTLGDAETYLDKALEHYQLRKDEVYKNNLFAIFIGTDPLERSDGQRPLYIVYGEDLNPLFERSFGSKTLDEVLREDVMVPQLQKGDFTSAITAALKEASSQLALNNTLKQSSGSGQTSLPSASTSIPSAPSANEPKSGFFSSLWWPVLLVLVILFLVFGMRKKPSTPKVKEKRLDPQQNLADRKTLELIIKDLSDNAASTGHDPYLPDDPAQQTDMQLLRRMLKEERPEDLQVLETQYKKAVEKLKALKTNLSGDSKSTDYGVLLVEGQELKKFTETLSDHWEDLDLQLSTFDDKRISAEERLQASYKTYDGLRQGEVWPETSRVFKSLIDLLAQSDSAKKQQRPFTALALLEELEAKLGQLGEQLPRLQKVSKTLSNFEGDLAGLQQQGYKASSAQSSFESAREQFRVALDLLKQDDYKVLDAQIDEASELTDALATKVQEQLALKDTNLKRLKELEQKGVEIKTLIEQAVPVFEQIQAYAESNWRDIKGNGTEAQKAANRAHELFDTAQAQQEAQNYEDAKNKIDMAFVELGQADELIDAIHLRLENLKKAKETSREELQLVEDEVKQHLAFVQQKEVDQMVSEAPEESLKEAYRRVAAARTELDKAEPSWLSIWEHVQAADKLSDAAFEQVRTEKDAMDRRQTLMASEKTEARVALERILKFAHLHPQDINEGVLQLVEEAQRLYAQAEEQENQTKQLEEASLATAFERAATLFDTAQQRAEAAFGEAESSFKAMEDLRQQTAASITEAETALRSFASFVSRNSLDRVFQSSLSQLERSLPGYDARASREELEQAAREAENVKTSISRLQEEAKSQAQAVEAELRKRRQEQVDLERRRRAAEMTRRSTGWGSWPSSLPPIIISPPRQSNIPRQIPRSMPSPGPLRLPTARSAPPVRLPSRSSPSPRIGGGRMSGGGWGGSGAKKGGGW